MNTEAIYNDLNDGQMQAVLTTKGYGRVIAGAGTGKTLVLTRRLCYLIQACGVDAGNILSINFTDEAANAMRWEVTHMLGRRGVLDVGNISTFHDLCLSVLRDNINLLHYPEPFTIIDRDDQMAFLHEIYSAMDIAADAYPPADMIAYIAELKSSLNYIPNATLSLTGDFALGLPLDFKDIHNVIFVNYLRKLRKYNALDFDDMLYFTLYLFKQHEDLLACWQNQLQYIQVDEFQDVNQAQYELIVLLQGKHKNLFVAGDPDQAIYSRHGSNISFINDFELKFPSARTFLLTTSYRSNSSILDVGNSLIRHNKNRTDNPLLPVTVNEGKVVHYQAQDDRDEACFIAKSIQGLMNTDGADLEDIAILYRSSYMTRQLEEALISFSIPYTVKGTAFYARQEIKDVLAFLSLLVYGDNISFRKVIHQPFRKMGRVRMEYLNAYAEHHRISLLKALTSCAEDPQFQQPEITSFVAAFEEVKSKLDEISMSQALEEILHKTGYEQMLLHYETSDRIESIRELKRAVAKYDEEAGGQASISGYLDEVTVYLEWPEEVLSGCVKLMPIHAAKGLEFPYVIVCGMNEGSFPSSEISSESEIEEERRLAYVAFTRAQDGLVLTSAAELNYDMMPRSPSRFLAEITPGLIREVKMLN